MTVVRLMVLPEHLVVVGSSITSGLPLVVGNLGSGDGLVGSALRALSSSNALIGSGLGLLCSGLAFTGERDGLIGGQLRALHVFDGGAAAQGDGGEHSRSQENGIFTHNNP